MRKPKIKITLVDRIGTHSCHRGHKIGDTFDFDTDCGKLCPMAMHVAFPYIDILRYSGTAHANANWHRRFYIVHKRKISHFQPETRDFWSRVRESNPPSRLGKPLYYRYTNPAL